MSRFIRLLADYDKASALQATCKAYRSGEDNDRLFWVEPKTFNSIPGKPFAYWITESVRRALQTFPSFEQSDCMAEHGASTKDDFRFLRASWEVLESSDKWTPFAKGGSYAPFYADIPLCVNWSGDAEELEAALLHKYPYLGESANWVLHRECRYGHPGLTWSKRTKSALSMRVLPKGCVFSDKGSAAFVKSDSSIALLALLGLCSSRAFRVFIELQLAAADARAGGAANSYEVGVIQRTPLPQLDDTSQNRLAMLARRGWVLKRTLDTVQETSHAFIVPAAVRGRLGDYDPSAIEAELQQIQTEIDDIAFELYGFSESDREIAARPLSMVSEDNASEEPEEDEDDAVVPPDTQSAMLSWAVGVAVGRFDWTLVTGQCKALPEPDPFDPLPAKSPGMLPEGTEPFHAHAGILVDDPGHPHDLARLIEEVFARVSVTAPDDVRRCLQREFFAFHLQRYSKSRRKAPIYWPLSTTSGGYTLWVYYPSLTSQTLYTAINDFVEPKLNQVGADVTALRNKGSARTRDDEKQFEALQAFELELIELRDTLLKLAPTYKPNHDDGVQISAAPLWPLFRHKPWQKVLKDTWAKLEKGDYDWAHLAMNYWPERVREKCKTDKSLAIAHGLEDLYIEPEAAPKKARKKKAGGDE
ncbi:hypothetical protein PZU33_03845 [Pseudomonas aeruginosa]|uniref:type II restriction endonuclease subunit M n=1 Tax=Pseudomonas aeruginosa TaxID=287 RepID=UPI0018C69C95|nr:type II restriction endonuclease subunit M [Pseudomonas aeruginosa]MBG4644447.1 type II restriction endonuclease subunit M [Pseudomonas aeruginosa]MBG5729558.1 type II restriction endonuclease subunit M [Pseudomonas aeruginosa]MDU0533934.1 hypothetical protein [Pseudomonas aeruginosa]MEA8678315.1 hypothetical protein [Pseudomonas aeruginosa]MEA8688580.1 hypothetical protein [Pseudomonas aeruginosa]